MVSAFYIFFILVFFYLIKKKIEFIYFIPIFNLGMDMSLTYFSGFSLPAYVRASILALFFMFSWKYFNRTRVAVSFYVFFSWIIFLLLFSNEFSYSFKYVSQVIFSMGMFVIAYTYFDSIEKLSKLLRGLYWVLVVAIVATAVGYLFGIGKVYDYIEKNADEEQIIGLLGSSGLYAPGIVISLLPLLLKSGLSNVQRKLLPFLVIILYVFMLLTVRRTVILIPLVGFVGYFIYSKFKFKLIRYLVLAVFSLILTFPLYSDILVSRFTQRQEKGRFDEEFYKTEQRYLENVELIDKLAAFENPGEILFGFGNNIFAENISDSEIYRRMYHTDIAKLFYGVGLFGIILYLVIYIHLFIKVIKIPNIDEVYDYKAAALGLFLISVLVSINGSVTIVTFRSVNFLLLGAILGYVNRQKKYLSI